MEKYPIKNKSDIIVDTIFVGTQFVPFGIGSAISEFVKSFLPSGYEMRKEKWLICLAEKIEKFDSEKNKIIEEYLSKEEGKTLLLKAVISAISTHKIEKYRVIRDVLLGTITDTNLNFDKKDLLLSIITELEPYDIFLLKLLDTVEEEVGNCKSYEEVYKLCMNKGFKGSKDEFTLIFHKLGEKSLIRISSSIDNYDDVYSVQVLVTSETNNKPKIIVTNLARDLLKYLENEV